MFFKRAEIELLIMMSRSASNEKLMAIDVAILQISNQKNGIGGVCVHHKVILGADLVCPVKAFAQHIIHIRRHTMNKNALMCAYWDKVGQRSGTNNNIRFLMKFSAIESKYPERGVEINRINTHLCQSGGACVIKLSGYSDSVIRKMGQWAPDHRHSWNIYSNIRKREKVYLITLR